MASGLVALLDDVAVIAKLAAASIDDIGAAAGKASMKAAGVVIDDTAVTPRYVTGLSPDRELPIIAKIARGSLFNKLVILLPAALLLAAFAPWAITPLLMAGGAYLCFEAAEKIFEAIGLIEHHGDEEIAAITDPGELEKRQVSGAVRTDFILSAEIMAIALNELPDQSLVMQGVILAVVAIAVTVGVYGVVAVIVKMDDIGLAMAKRGGAGAGIGRGLVAAMPKLLSALSVIGTAAMLWVGGGIVLHGLHEYGVHAITDPVDAVEAAIGGGAFIQWFVHAVASAIVGIVVGGAVILALKLVPKKPANA